MFHAGEFVGVEPQPHGVFLFTENLNVSHTGQPFQSVHDIDGGVVAQEEVIILGVFRVEADDQNEIGRLFLGGDAVFA
jgi:hypothetical protein